MDEKFWVDVGRAIGVAIRLLTLFAPILYVINTHV